jgi:hypothetical protein
MGSPVPAPLPHRLGVSMDRKPPGVQHPQALFGYPHPCRYRGPIPADPRVSALPGFNPGPPENLCSVKPGVEATRPNTCRSGSFQGGKKTRLPTRGRIPKRAVTRRTGELGGDATRRRHRRRRDLGANLAAAVTVPPQLRRPSLATEKR